MKNDEDEFADELDFSDGFGGISEDVDLTQNIGCASNQRKKKATSFEDLSQEAGEEDDK
jgi:hypothetical protein